MKALSIRQPWAWAILYAGKDIENRTRPFKHRGPMLIQASAYKPSPIDLAEFRMLNARQVEAHTGKPFDEIFPATFTLGSIVGVVDVVEVVASSRSPWFLGPYGLVLANARRLQPFGWRGQLGLFDVPDDTPELVRALANAEVL
jgi:hypothetical protein